MDQWFLFGQDADFDAGLRHYRQGQYGEAASALEFCLTRPCEPSIRILARQYLTECLSQLAEQSRNEGHPLEAVALLGKAVTLHPEFPDLRFRLARNYFLLQDYDNARSETITALELNPQFRNARMLGILLTLVTEGKQAGWEEYARFSDDLDLLDGPVDADSLYTSLLSQLDQKDGLADLLSEAHSAMLARKPDRAVLLYQDAVELHPGYADLRYLYGQCLAQLDRLEDAEAQLMIALQINAKYADAHAMLGVLYVRQREREQAERAFRRALAIEPTHSVAILELDRLAMR